MSGIVAVGKTTGSLKTSAMLSHNRTVTPCIASGSRWHSWESHSHFLSVVVCVSVLFAADDDTVCTGAVLKVCAFPARSIGMVRASGSTL